MPMTALLIFTSRTDIMGSFVNGPIARVAAVAGTAAVFVLNFFLIILTLGVPIPGLSGS